MLPITSHHRLQLIQSPFTQLPSADYKCSRRLSVTHLPQIQKDPESVEIDTRSEFAPRTPPPRNSDPDDASRPSTSEPQLRSRASFTLAQGSPVFVRVCATGRRPGSFKTCSSPRSLNSPASLYSSLPQGTNPILFQSQTTPPNQHRPHLRHTHHTVTPPAPHPAKVHPTCISYRYRTTPALSFVKSQPLTHSQRHPATASHPVKPNSAHLQLVPSPVFVQARESPCTCPSSRTGSTQLPPEISSVPACAADEVHDCPTERGGAGPSAIADKDISAPVRLEHQP